MTITVRHAKTDDFPPLYVILEDYQARFLTDYQYLDKQQLLTAIQESLILVLEEEGYPIGAVWFYDIKDDVYASFCFIVRPRYLLQVQKRKLLEGMIDKIFDLVGVRKIKTEVVETQTGAIKWLKRLMFKECGMRRNETRVRGKLRDVYYFELHRNFWNRKMGIEEEMYV